MNNIEELTNIALSLREREELEFYRYFIVREGLEFECALEFHKFKERAKKGRRTYLQDFLEKYPNAMMHNGVPETCRDRLVGESDCTGKSCEECWNEIMEESI